MSWDPFLNTWTVLLQYINSTATVIIVPWFKTKHVKWGEKKKSGKTQRRIQRKKLNPNGALSVYLVCALAFWTSKFQEVFFFFYQCLLHWSWNMNSANRHVNSNFKSEQITGKWFFIVFSFQQNKWYPNTHSYPFF